MSAIANATVVSRPRPNLRPLPPARRQIARVPFVIICLMVLGLGMSGILVLNVTLQNQGFEVRAAQQQAKELGYQEEALESLVLKMRSPAEVANRAEQLGMVPNNRPMFVKIPSGEIIGGAQPGSEMSSNKGPR